MSAIPVIAIFDIGKTNKKLFLFDEAYRVVFEKSARIKETTDEDGYPSEDLNSLKAWVLDSLTEVTGIADFLIKGVNFSAYGASFVYIDEDGQTLTALYNYLKPYPENLGKRFYETYGGEQKFSIDTASPILGSLNSGLQLYRLKVEQPEIFSRVAYALHLPQYLSFLFTGQPYSDLTSIGCHTALWDFTKNKYHEWTTREGIALKLAPLSASDRVLTSSLPNAKYKVGCGLHDSSAALIPYLLNITEPFILISTGTWCINLNPFNQSPLTAEELKKDCLCYMQYNGRPVKASRLFIGFEHEQQVKRIAEYFNEDVITVGNIVFDPAIIADIKRSQQEASSESYFNKEPGFVNRDLSTFKNSTEAYHQLIFDLVHLQSLSTRLVLEGAKVETIFVDGGFSKNSIFMHLIADCFSGINVFAASAAQASATGAALSIHAEWNTKPVPADIIQLKRYPANFTDI